MTLAVYLRAIIVDVVADDASPSSLVQGLIVKDHSPGLLFEQRRRPISTWVLKDERNRLKVLAGAEGVTLAVYLRAVIADVMFEELHQTPKALE